MYGSRKMAASPSQIMFPSPVIVGLLGLIFSTPGPAVIVVVFSPLLRPIGLGDPRIEAGLARPPPVRLKVGLDGDDDVEIVVVVVPNGLVAERTCCWAVGESAAAE